MMVTEMTRERVFELIAAYGAEPMGWPEDEREAARALLADDPDAFSEALAEARAIDEALNLELVPEPSPALANAILSAAPRASQPRKGLIERLADLVFPQGARWPAGAALASLVMGLVGGYAYASTGVGYDQVDSAYYAAFGLDSGEAWVSLE